MPHLSIHAAGHVYNISLRILLCAVTLSNYGCRVHKVLANLFDCEDILMTLAPSWHALETMILNWKAVIRKGSCSQVNVILN